MPFQFKYVSLKLFSLVNKAEKTQVGLERQVG